MEFELVAEFDWLTYATLLPALPHHAVLPLLDCVTLELLLCAFERVAVKLMLKPPQTASSSLSVKSRIVVTPFWACVLLRKACLAKQGVADFSAAPQAILRLGLIHVSINDTSG
jgi:hypothetical protein